MKLFRVLLLFIISAKGAQASQSALVSLYSGNEASFTPQDKEKTLSALNALGIDYERFENLILVPASQKPLAQRLIAKYFLSLRHEVTNP